VVIQLDTLGPNNYIQSHHYDHIQYLSGLLIEDMIKTLTHNEFNQIYKITYNIWC